MLVATHCDPCNSTTKQLAATSRSVPSQKAQGLGIRKVRVQLKGIGKGRQVCAQV